MSPRATPLPWHESVRQTEAPLRERFIESYLGHVRAIALRISARLPSSVDPDDLIQEGVVGLLDAIDRFEPARGVPFGKFAERRIQGAILDELRRRDWRPRSLRDQQRRIDTAVSTLRARLRRHGTEDEIAESLGVEVSAYRSMLVALATGPTLCLDEIALDESSAAADDEAERPDARSERRSLLDCLAREIAELPEREARVIQLYYFSGLNMKEIGGVLGVTESRICQLHSQAASRLRSALLTRLSAGLGSARGATR